MLRPPLSATGEHFERAPLFLICDAQMESHLYRQCYRAVSCRVIASSSTLSPLKKKFHNLSKHITYTFHLQSFISGVNALLYIFIIRAGNQPAQGHPCWKHVEAQTSLYTNISIIRKRDSNHKDVHHAMEKYCTQPATTWAPSVWLYFGLNGSKRWRWAFLEEGFAAYSSYGLSWKW